MRSDQSAFQLRPKIGESDAVRRYTRSDVLNLTDTFNVELNQKLRDVGGSLKGIHRLILISTPQIS